MKCIVFDMDGVLFDTCAIAEESIVQQYPDITKEQQKEILAGNFHEELAKLSLVKKSETQEEKEIRQMQYAYNKSQSLMYEGMREMLFDLHSLGHKIALNTSAWDRNCLPLMEQAQILHLFDFVGTAEISKSKVEKFSLIKEKYSIESQDMIFITDTLGDVREAKIANVPTVAVTWGAHNESYFKRELNDNLIAIVNTVDELRAFLE